MTTYYYSKNTGTSGLNQYNKTVKAKKPSVGEKLLHTTGDIFANIISGAAKGLEGIVDLGAGIGGAIAGIFDKNAQNDIKNFMAKDLTGELFANKWQDDLRYSYLNDSKVGQFAEKTFNAVGQMLPAVAVGLVTGGVGAAASVSQAASLATMGVSAAGTSTEEAYNEGADYYKGLGYGVASGTVEMATEKMTGGALKGVIGKGMLDGVGKVAATGAKRVLKNAVEEGAEEVVSELANPALKSIYKGKEAFDEYGDAEYWKGVAEAGLVGGATSVVYGGTVGKVLAKTGHGYTGKDADVAESAEKVRELENERNELWADGKLTAEQNAKIDGYIARNSANIEAVLKNSNQEKRTKLIREFNLERRFDETGNQRILPSNAENARYLSPSISKTQVETDLRSMTENLRQEYARQNGGNVEIAAKNIPDMRVYDGKLSAKGEQAYTRFKKAVNALNRISGVDVGVAVLAPNPTARYNGSIINDNIYIAADNFEDGTWAKTLVHEYTHFAEGTAAYNNLVSFLSSDKALNVAAIGEYIDRGYAGNGGADIDPTGEIEYNKKKEYSRKTPYSQYRTLAKIWSHETGTKVGDIRQINNPKTGMTETIMADNSDEGYHVIGSYVPKERTKHRIKERNNDGHYSRKSEADRRFHRYDAGTEDGRVEYRGDSDIFAGRNAVESVDGLHGEESTGGRLTVSVQSDNVGESRVDSAERSDLTVAELAYVKRIVSNKNFTSETGAIMSERALGNERFISKLVRSDTYLAEKAINKIKDGIENLRSFQTAEKRAEYKFLQQAEKLYLKAIEEAGYKYVGGKIIRPDKDEEETDFSDDDLYNGELQEQVDVSHTMTYSKKGYKARNPSSITEKDFNHHYWAVANNLLSKEEIGVLNSSIGKLNNGEFFNQNAEGFYMIPVGKNGVLNKIVLTDGKNKRYSIDTVIEINLDNETDLELAREYIYDGESKGITAETGELFKAHYCKDYEFDDFKRKIWSSQQNSDGKQDGTRSIEKTKFSLKTDFKGRQISEGQKEIESTFQNENNGDEIKLSRKTIRYLSYDSVGQDAVREIRSQLSKAYNGISNSVADGVAIESGNIVYIVDSGKENGDIRFGIRHKLVISDSKLRAEYIRRTNNESIRKGYISDELSSRFGDRYDNDRTSDRGQELGKKLSVDTRKSEDNEGRISFENGDRGVRGLKFSLKTDSKGRQLSEGQKYSKKVAKYISYDKIGNENIRAIRRKLSDIYQGIDDAIADGIAIENDNTIYVVDSGKENGEIRFGIRNIIMMLDAELRKINVEDINDRAISKGYISDEISKRIKRSSGDGGGSSVGRQLQKELSVDTRKSEDNEGRISFENGDRGVRGLKFSLKTDSKGRQLSEGQKYSKKVAKYISYDKIGNENIRAIRRKLSDIYQGIDDAIADGIAIENDNTIYVVDSGKDNGGIRFGIRRKITIKDSERRERYIKNINKESAENGFGNRAIFERTGIKLDNDSRSDVGRKHREDLPSAKRKSEDNEGRFPSENGDRGVHLLKFSLKTDSDGRQLSEGQKEFFKDSKVVDKDGNLLVMYHGANLEFNTFDLTKAGSNFGETAQGFFFFTNKKDSYSDSAIDYAREASKRTGKPIVKEVYLNIKKPLKLNSKGYYNTIAYYDKNSDNIYDQYFKGDYDGVIIEDSDKASDDSILCLVDSANQIKRTDNLRPTYSGDIRYSLREDSDETSRQYAQYNAEKVYTKKDVNEVLKNVCACLEFDDGSYGDITGHKGEITDMLYEALNTKPEGERYKTALDIADYIIGNAFMKNIYAKDSDTWAVEIINALRPYLHNIKLDSIKGEIKHRYGNDRRVHLLWSSKNGVSPDVVAQSLAEEGIEIDSLNEADMFFKIDELYTEAKRTLNEKKREGLNKAFEEEELQRIRSDMAKEILRGYDYTGGQTAYTRMKQKYDEKITSLKNHIGELTEKNFAANSLLESITKLRETNMGEFLNSTQYKPDIFKATIGGLTAIEYRGNINKSGTRRLIMNLREWYQPENNIFAGDAGIQDNELYRSRTSYNKDVGTILDIISSGKGDLSLMELKYLKYAVDYFTNLISTHNKIRRNGVYVEAKPVAERLVRIARENKNIRLGWLENAYTRTFGDPYSVVRLMDKYAMDKDGETGFYTETFDEFRKSAISAAEMMMRIRMPIDEFMNENKGYINKITVEKVKYNAGDDDSSAIEISKANAFSLYMTLKRKQAMKGMAHSGFLFVENGKDVRIPGFLGTDVEITDETIEGIAGIIRDRLFSQFSEADKKYISIIEKILNEDCKLAKYAVDMRRQGYSNVLDDYYFPIRRAHIAKSVDSFINEMDCVSNAPFNKNTVKGAKNELLISSVSEVVDRHIRAVSMYSCLAEAIDNYNVLFNIDIAENVNKPVSIRTETADIWRKKKDNTFDNKANDYFKNLVKDILGVSTEGNTVWARGLSFIRGGYAKFQLGLNPKVLFSQLSSYIASSSVLDYSALVKGMKISGKDVDKYCPLARVRNYDKSAIKAQGVIDKVGTVGDVLMKPISMVDRFVITRLFGACQAQAEINGKGKVGSKSNLKAAGELLTKVILNTQQNNLATERSAAMRSNHEFMKAITMFTADAMKVMGRVIDTIGESSALKRRIKLCTDSARRAELESRLKEVRKKEAKSISALVMSAVYMACVAQLFRWLYNRDDEDENIALNMALDAIGNLFGGLPGIKDLYAKLADGYELDNYAYSVINDLFDSVDEIVSSAEKVIDGKAEKQDDMFLIKKMFYSVGQLFGIPVRNLYNMATGITRRISPSAGYKIDAFFYSKNYRSDLKKALENGDEKMIATIAGLIMNEDVGDIKDESVREELDTLIKDGYDVLPRIIGDNVTYKGDEYALKAKDREHIESMYTNANESLSNIMKTARYKNASAAVRAKTVKNTYRLSYEIAVADIVGDKASSEKNVLFSQVFDVALLSFIFAAVSNLASDKDKNGNAVNGSLKRKIEYYLDTLNLTKAQKYIIMGYFGYKNQNGEKEVKGYISRFGLTSSQQDSILEYCGY